MKKLIFQKIKSTAMFYALFLMTIVSIVLAGLFQLSTLNQQLHFKLSIEEQLMNNANSGIAYAQAYFLELPPNQKHTVRLFDEGIDSVEIQIKQWGAYPIISSTALHQNQKINKIVMVGSQSPTTLPNLYLVDIGNPLSVCGKTRIEGNIYLPKRGIKRGYIGGKSYTGNKLLYGTKHQSKQTLPQLNKTFLSKYENFEAQKTDWDNQLNNINVPFDSVAVNYYSPKFIYLTQSIKGQVIIESKDSIIVSKTAQLNQVILKSPKIIIEKGFKGSLQCIASQHINIGEDVILKYPSVLALIEKKSTDLQSEIMIDKNAQMVGSILLISKNPNFRMPLKLSINENSTVNGFVFCAGETQLKGTVNGSLYTNKFYLKTSSSAYQNYLLDATIKNDLPNSFIPIPLIESSNKIKVIKWLN